jgi:2-hydroxy-3-oxopropionate reductase
MSDLGFLGLGTMGRPLAGHLQAAGHRLFHRGRDDASRLPRELLDRGAVACGSGREVAELAEVVFLMVPDTLDVAAALFGPGGVAEGLSPGKIVVDMSSISPIETKVFAERIRTLGCAYLDAPVSGGEVGAMQASLTIMVGGDEPAFERVLPLFRLLGKHVTRVGGNGDGQTAKVANQMIVALTIEAIGEALLFASTAGADPGKVRSALLRGFAASRVREVHGERMLRRAFDPGFRIELQLKDLDLALAGARALGLSLPNTASRRELLNACVARGGTTPRSSARSSGSPTTRSRPRRSLPGGPSGASSDPAPNASTRLELMGPRPVRGSVGAPGQLGGRGRLRPQLFDRGEALEPQVTIEDLAEVGRIASPQGIEHLLVLAHGFTPTVALQRVGRVSRRAEAAGQGGVSREQERVGGGLDDPLMDHLIEPEIPRQLPPDIAGIHFVMETLDLRDPGVADPLAGQAPGQRLEPGQDLE